AVINRAPRSRALEKIGVSLERGRRVEGKPSHRFEQTDKTGDMLSEPVRIYSSQSDIQEILLAETPTITLHVGAKIELGRIATNARCRLLLRRHLELKLLRNHSVLSRPPCAGEPSHRAEMPARAYHHASAYLSIRDPALAGAVEAG